MLYSAESNVTLPNRRSNRSLQPKSVRLLYVEANNSSQTYLLIPLFSSALFVLAVRPGIENPSSFPSLLHIPATSRVNRTVPVLLSELLWGQVINCCGNIVALVLAFTAYAADPAIARAPTVDTVIIDGDTPAPVKPIAAINPPLVVAPKAAAPPTPDPTNVEDADNAVPAILFAATIAIDFAIELAVTALVAVVAVAAVACTDVVALVCASAKPT